MSGAESCLHKFIYKLKADLKLSVDVGGIQGNFCFRAHLPAVFLRSIFKNAGHQWVKNKLGVMPQSGWSIDPFGHGPTVPYLLKASGMEGGAVIQRIHYAWKQWLAKERAGDFLWRQVCQRNYMNLWFL